MNRLTKKTYMIYGLGVSYFMLDRLFVTWINNFYIPSKESGLPALLTPALLTIGYIIIRLIDAIADPIVGYMSDNSKSRFGRRSFYMMLGGIPLGLSLVLLFYPPMNNQIATLIHFIVVGSVFFISYTLVGGPYNSLVADMTETKKERIDLSTVQSVFRLIFSAIPMVLSGILLSKFTTAEDLSNGLKYSVSAYQKSAIIFSVIAVIGIYFCAIFLNEKKVVVKRDETVHVSFRKTFKFLLNKDIILYFLGLLSFFAAFNIIQTSMYYYVDTILKVDNSGKVVSLLSTLIFVGAAVFFPLTNILTKKFGYKKIMILDLILLIIGMLGMIFLYYNMIFVYISIIIIGAGTSGAGFIFPPAMLSEIASEVSEKTHTPVEGLLFGIQGFFLKMAFMIKAIITINASVYKGIPGIDGKVNVTKEGTILTLIIAIVLFVFSIIFYALRKEKK